MKNAVRQKDVVAAWLQIPVDLHNAIASNNDLEQRAGRDNLSLRELVHHLAESNIVASSMIIAALGSSGSTYDWSWLYPDNAWNERLGYEKAPIEPALESLRSLLTYISGIVARIDGGLEREIMLFDSPGAEKYSRTVAEIIQQEVDHAKQHFDDFRGA